MRVRLLSRLVTIAREAWTSALAEPVASGVTVLIVAGMCATVILTAGRSVGAERDVLKSLDDVGTRAIVVRASAGSGLDSTVLARLLAVDGIDQSIAFGPARDVRNAAIPEGARVPLRTVQGFEDLETRADERDRRGSVWVSSEARRSLGMAQPAGALIDSDGRDYSVIGDIRLPRFLQSLAPVVLEPHPATETLEVTALVVVAHKPHLVVSMTKAIVAVLDADPAKITLETSEQLAILRTTVENQLGSFGRDLTMLISTITAVLVAVVYSAIVMMRRRDFGRRRALGASRSFIVWLLITNAATLATSGAVVGSVAGLTVLKATGSPTPAVEYVLAVSVFAIATGCLAATIPAAVAANRDPVKELRVP